MNVVGVEKENGKPLESRRALDCITQTVDAARQTTRKRQPISLE